MSSDESTIPSSTAEFQIFPLGRCSSNFNTGDYDPEFADGKATYREITQVINDIQLARQPAVRKKWLLAFLTLWIDIILFAIIVFVRAFLFRPSKIVDFIFMIILFIFLTLVDDFYKKKDYKIDQESKDACYKILDSQYKVAFEAKGLRWFLPTHFPRWVELQKINAKNNQETAQPIYVPPAMH